MTEIKARPDPVRVSERAARRISEILAREGQPGLKLRVSVSGGGCSGFQYQFELDDQAEEGDIAIERDGARVVIDGMSLMYLLGCELDYVEDLTGSYFRVTNPNAT
ncbi:MAG TPA: iron-sulfur cluster insertion protein ErpA, partial [Geminicoccaceae bacterium]|nr:iron-sulfur cluster insertion protein ErpA [Geminicoccaceae bacterium]